MCKEHKRVLILNQVWLALNFRTNDWILTMTGNWILTTLKIGRWNWSLVIQKPSGYLSRWKSYPGSLWSFNAKRRGGKVLSNGRALSEAPILRYFWSATLSKTNSYFLQNSRATRTNFNGYFRWYQQAAEHHDLKILTLLFPAHLFSQRVITQPNTCTFAVPHAAMISLAWLSLVHQGIKNKQANKKSCTGYFDALHGNGIVWPPAASIISLQIRMKCSAESRIFQPAKLFILRLTLTNFIFQQKQWLLFSWRTASATNVLTLLFGNQSIERETKNFGMAGI